MLRNLLSVLCFAVLSHSLSAQCPGRVLSHINWDVATWLDGNMEAGFGMGTNNVVISIRGNTAPGYPNQMPSFNEAGGHSEGGNALVLANRSADTIMVDLTFESRAHNIRFSLYDIDLDDTVYIETNGGSAAIAAESNESTFAVGGSTAMGTGGKSDNDPSGTANISITNASKVSIMIFRKKGNIFAGISDIIACTGNPPVPNCDEESNSKLDWRGYPAGSLEHSIAMQGTDGEALTANITFSGDTDHFNQTQKHSQAPDDTDRFSKTDGGFSDGSNSLQIRVDAPPTATSSKITTTIAFDKSLYDVRFSVFDIDNNTAAVIDSSDRIDQVIITGYHNQEEVMPVLEAFSNSPAWSRSGNVVTGHPLGEKDAEDGGTRNTLNVYFTVPIDQIEISYIEKGYTDPQRPANYDPTRRTIALSPVFFCTSLDQTVEIETFEVDEEEDHVKVTWSSRKEANTSHYEVLKSEDLRNYASIGFMPVHAKAKSSSSYLIKDRSLDGQDLHYKLRIVDHNGRVSYSNIQSIHRNSTLDQQAKIFPNPALDRMTLNGVSPLAELSIINIYGQAVKEIQIQTSTDGIELDVSNLTPGMYHLSYKDISASEMLPFIKIK